MRSFFPVLAWLFLQTIVYAQAASSLPPGAQPIWTRSQRLVDDAYQKYVVTKQEAASTRDEARESLREQLDGSDLYRGREEDERRQLIARLIADHIPAQSGNDNPDAETTGDNETAERVPRKRAPLPETITLMLNRAKKLVQNAVKERDNAKTRYISACEKALNELAAADRRFGSNSVDSFKVTVLAPKQKESPEVIVVSLFVEGLTVVGPSSKYRLIEDNLSWNDAKKKCEELGGHLLIINDSRELRFIQAALKPVLKPGNDQMWMGATTNSQGAWTWLNGTSVANFGWAQNFPVPDAGKAFLVMTGNGEYINLRGNNQPGTRFICEWDK